MLSAASHIVEHMFDTDREVRNLERHDAGPTDDLGGLSDHDLLAGGLGDQMAENFYAWRRLDRLDRFRARLERTYQARRAVDPHFTPTPLQ